MQVETLNYKFDVNKKVKGSGKYVDVLNDFYDDEEQQTLLLKCSDQKEKNLVMTSLKHIKDSQSLNYVLWSKRTSLTIYVIKA